MRARRVARAGVARLEEDGGGGQAREQQHHREAKDERLGQVADNEKHRNDERVEQHAEDRHRRGALRVAEFNRAEERDGGPVDAEKELEGAEGAEQRLVVVAEQRHGHRGHRSREDEREARSRRERVREKAEGLRARHLAQHEDGEDQAVADGVRSPPLERGRPHEDEEVQRRLVQRIHKAQRHQRARGADAAPRLEQRAGGCPLPVAVTLGPLHAAEHRAAQQRNDRDVERGGELVGVRLSQHLHGEVAYDAGDDCRERVAEGGDREETREHLARQPARVGLSDDPRLKVGEEDGVGDAAEQPAQRELRHARAIREQARERI
mmetsp:Transcript_48366/g.112004  ORF Transcript_48366/g.112004 Transcript_48366/m.112004 type:complete len:323 (-) Transcript_48366:627-1595(-)